MNAFAGLTLLFLRDLIRRRSLWIVIALLLAMLAINYYIQQEFQFSLERGERYDIASRRAVGMLEEYAGSIRELLMVGIVIIATLVAPESRRNGTTQFVLSIPLGRLRVALAQFAALGILVTLLVLVLHLGFCVTAWEYRAMDWWEMGTAWAPLLLSCLLLAAPVFAFSTVGSIIATLILFLVLPHAMEVAVMGLQSVRALDLGLLVKLLENIRMLFPRMEQLLFWPHLPAPNPAGLALAPEWGWLLLHELAVACFWCLLGYWLYRNHDFGSRTALH